VDWSPKCGRCSTTADLPVNSLQTIELQLPALVGWGGSWDYLGVNLEWASQNLEEELEA
jgi:hypothetical protein